MFVYNHMFQAIHCVLIFAGKLLRRIDKFIYKTRSTMHTKQCYDVTFSLLETNRMYRNFVIDKKNNIYKIFVDVPQLTVILPITFEIQIVLRGGAL